MATPADQNALLDLYYTKPQTRVKVSGQRRLNLLIAGEGEPTVIFAPGGGASTLEWMLVQHPIAAKTRTGPVRRSLHARRTAHRRGRRPWHSNRETLRRDRRD